MQTSLRKVDCASRLLRSQILLNTQHIQWEARRHASFNSPLNWLRERLGPNLRKKESKQEVEAAKQQAAEEGKRSLFETAGKTTERAEKVARAEQVAKGLAKKVRKPKPTFHKYSTANFKISHRKLNMLGQQISQKPIDYAILQMQFSEKRASTRIKSMLSTAKEHAVRYKALDESKLVVAEAWVTKGPRQHKRMEPKGRAHYGVRIHPDSRLHVVLKEGKTLAERKAEERQKKLKRIVSAGLVRENRPIRNPASTWCW
ncbi:hypothetical protein ONZ45_g456 [Pleurotus djamor]|nr:hypothetical protein ONZ45_g456 [Pleurotus djamor]